MTTRGTVLAGRYVLERVLGKGGMGQVWIARHTSLDRLVAVKLMTPEAHASDVLRARFEREAKACGQLRSPHVVQVFDYGMEGDHPYLVMELLEGDDLAVMQRSRPIWSLAEVASIVQQAARGLAEAHEVGIVHRDIKLSNLFMARMPGESMIKILDFGIAKAFESQGPKMTGVDVQLGTPSYMAPELLTGRDVDHRIDLWALAVVAYRLLTGRAPFTGDHPAEVAQKIVAGDRPAPTRIVEGLPPALDAFFDRALAAEPDLRFASATELASALSTVGAQASAAIGRPRDESSVDSARASTSGAGAFADPATLHPPTLQPSTLHPPTLQPSTMQPSTMHPPTLQPSTLHPPTLQPSTRPARATLRMEVPAPRIVEPTVVTPSSPEPDRAVTLHSAMLRGTAVTGPGMHVPDVTPAAWRPAPSAAPGPLGASPPAPNEARRVGRTVAVVGLLVAASVTAFVAMRAPVARSASSSATPTASEAASAPASHEAAPSAEAAAVSATPLPSTPPAAVSAPPAPEASSAEAAAAPAATPATSSRIGPGVPPRPPSRDLRRKAHSPRNASLVISSTRRTSRRPSGRAVSALAATALALASGVAHAEPQAERLFEEGKRLMTEGRIPEACAAFDKSFAIDRQGGTLMGLAICHEKQGLLATALREYERAAEIAKAGDRPDRVEHALLAVESLRPRVPHLIVEVAQEGRPESLVVKVDGVALAPLDWNSDLTFDPGPHRIEWSAEGIPDGSAEVDLKPSARERVPIRFPKPDEPPGPVVTGESEGLEPTTIAAIATGATGIAAIGAGTVLGILALGKSSDAEADCDPGGPPVRCGPEGLAAFESGRDLALAADIGLGAGIVLAAASVTLFLWPIDEDDDAEVEAARPTLRAGFGVGSATVDFSTGF